jgi:hypothetical protein
VAELDTAACAIGRLPGDGPWVGFRREIGTGGTIGTGCASDAGNGGGYRLAFEGSGAPFISPATGRLRRSELLTAAIAHFEEALEAAPPELEATQADLAGLVGWLWHTEQDRDCAVRLAEAVDAIDDGLAGEVVVARLQAALPVRIRRGDAVAALSRRYRQVLAGQ